MSAENDDDANGTGNANATDAAPNEDRDAILERRRRMVTTALAGFAGATLLACGKALADPDAGVSPQPCLSKPVQLDAEAVPSPCLSFIRVLDAGDGGRSAKDASAAPQPCLKLAPKRD